MLPALHIGRKSSTVPRGRRTLSTAKLVLLVAAMYTCSSSFGLAAARSRLAWAGAARATTTTTTYSSTLAYLHGLTSPAASRQAVASARSKAGASWWGAKSLRHQKQQRAALVRPLMMAAPDSGEPHMPVPPESLLRQLMPDVPVNMPTSAGNGHGLAQHSSQQHDILVQDILSLPPECVDVMPPPAVLEPTANPAEGASEDGNGSGSESFSSRAFNTEQTNYFVEMLRNSASYISMHRGAIMVLHLPGDLIGTSAFEKTLDDIALMSLLGVKIVLVCGVAAQVDHRLRSNSQIPRYCGDTRITDSETLRIVKEEAGFARCEVESALSRGFKGRPGLMGINVVGGNFFYSAKPLGVIEGIDFGYTGEVRKVEAEQITRRLDQGDVVLLTTLGYSASGQVFNVVSEQLAAETAASLCASKLIFITGGQTLVDTRTKHVIQSMRLKDAKNLLTHHCISLYPATVTDECRIEGKPILSEIRASAGNHLISMLRFCRYSVQALSKGVRRAHLVAPGNGRLLQEIFTRDGSGTLISRDLYDGIRPATVADVAGIMDIIQPLIQEGVLTTRSQKEIERDIVQYYVFTRDGLTVACGQLRKFGDCAEIGCLAVHPSYRKGGRGDAMLVYLERIAVNAGLTTIFVLSTRTMQWFLERGFQEQGVEALPPERREMYNWQRRSKIYMKKLKTSRDLDAEELFMNV